MVLEMLDGTYYYVYVYVYIFSRIFYAFLAWLFYNMHFSLISTWMKMYHSSEIQVSQLNPNFKVLNSDNNPGEQK